MELVAVAPASENYVTIEDLTNEENELIFVQHPASLSSDVVKKAVFDFERKGLDVAYVKGQSVYPMAFNDNGLTVSRKAEYVIVCEVDDE